MLDSHPIALLPDAPLRPDAPIARRFFSPGIRRYREAARHIWHLPYGRNTDRADYRLVLNEGRGTCSTKHALLAALAAELGLPVVLSLKLFEMTARSTPAVAETLTAFGLDSVPDAHCVLRSGPHRVDLTWPSEQRPAPTCLETETIRPDQIGRYKVDRHSAFLETRARAKRLDPSHVWQAREACIAALSTARP